MPNSFWNHFLIIDVIGIKKRGGLGRSPFNEREPGEWYLLRKEFIISIQFFGQETFILKLRASFVVFVSILFLELVCRCSLVLTPFTRPRNKILKLFSLMAYLAYPPTYGSVCGLNYPMMRAILLYLIVSFFCDSKRRNRLRFFVYSRHLSSFKEQYCPLIVILFYHV